MSGPVIKVARTAKILNENTEYGKRMMRLSNKIFGEVTRPADPKSMRVVEIMSAEPWEQQETKSPEYYPNLPMFHYLTKMLKMHGIYNDEHLVYRELQNEMKLAKGKLLHPPIGAGKRQQKGK